MARLLAEARPADLAGGPGRVLLAGMAEGREATVQALAGLGVPSAPGQRAAEAVLERMADLASKSRQQELAGRIDTAARLMAPADFTRWLAEQTASLAAEPIVAGKLAERA